jgi:hypothetical protein
MLEFRLRRGFGRWQLYAKEVLKMRPVLIALSIIIILFPSNLLAQVQMVTRPERESVELTIYNSRDLTLVREQRNVTLKSGLNLLQFSWVDTLIDPTSIRLKTLDSEADVHVKSAIFPPRLPNTIQWQVEAEEPGERALEVSYFTKTMSLEASVTISNDSGDDYENAQTRLVVGDVKLVEEVRELAAGIEEDKALKRAEARQLGTRRRGRGVETEEAGEQLAFFAARAPAVAETQAVSEYYMYVLKGRDTIKHEWQKRKLSFIIDEIPIKTVHRFGEHGDSVARFYQFKNDEEHNLGKEPLPRGNVKVFVESESTQIRVISSYIGEADIDFTPVGKEVKLYMGSDPEIKVKKRQMNIRRLNLQFDKDKKLVRFDTEREYTFEIESYKTEDANLEIKENLGRDWEILSSSHEYEQKDAHSIEFKLKLPAGGKDMIRYEVRLQGR